MGGFISSLFGGASSAPAVITPTVAAPADNSEKIKAAAQAEAERVRKRKGAASTIQTAAQGVLEPAATFKQVLGA
jgi:hypothetical protein